MKSEFRFLRVIDSLLLSLVLPINIRLGFAPMRELAFITEFAAPVAEVKAAFFIRIHRL